MAEFIQHKELKHRLASCFMPYHQQLNSEIHQIYQNHGCAYILDCHSMTQFDGKKRGRKERPQIDIGTRNGESCSQEYAECVADSYSDLGYDVKINGRFVGGEIILRYGWPEIDHHILQVEIRRDLYMNEDNREKNEHFVKMQNDCGNALTQIKEYINTKSN
jgi:N-formylglutamate deformylase